MVEFLDAASERMAQLEQEDLEMYQRGRLEKSSYSYHNETPNHGDEFQSKLPVLLDMVRGIIDGLKQKTSSIENGYDEVSSCNNSGLRSETTDEQLSNDEFVVNVLPEYAEMLNFDGIQGTDSSNPEMVTDLEEYKASESSINSHSSVNSSPHKQLTHIDSGFKVLSIYCAHMATKWRPVLDSQPIQGNEMSVAVYYDQFYNWKKQLEAVSYIGDEQSYIDDFIWGLKRDLRMRVWGYKWNPQTLFGAFRRALIEENIMKNDAPMVFDKNAEQDEENDCVVLGKMAAQVDAHMVFVEMSKPIIEDLLGIGITAATYNLLYERPLLTPTNLDKDLYGKYVIAQDLNYEDVVLEDSVANCPLLSLLEFSPRVFDPGTLFKQEENERQTHYIISELLLIYSQVYRADISSVNYVIWSKRPFVDFHVHVGALAQMCTAYEQTALRLRNGYDMGAKNANTIAVRAVRANRNCFSKYWFEEANSMLMRKNLYCWTLSLDRLPIELRLLSIRGSIISLLPLLKDNFKGVDGLLMFIFDPGGCFVLYSGCVYSEFNNEQEDHFMGTIRLIIRIQDLIHLIRSRTAYGCGIEGLLDRAFSANGGHVNVQYVGAVFVGRHAHSARCCPFDPGGNLLYQTEGNILRTHALSFILTIIQRVIFIIYVWDMGQCALFVYILVDKDAFKRLGNEILAMVIMRSTKDDHTDKNCGLNKACKPLWQLLFLVAFSSHGHIVWCSLLASKTGDELAAKMFIHLTSEVLFLFSKIRAMDLIKLMLLLVGYKGTSCNLGYCTILTLENVCYVYFYPANNIAYTNVVEGAKNVVVQNGALLGTWLQLRNKDFGVCCLLCGAQWWMMSNVKAVYHLLKTTMVLVNMKAFVWDPGLQMSMEEENVNQHLGICLVDKVPCVCSTSALVLALFPMSCDPYFMCLCHIKIQGQTPYAMLQDQPQKYRGKLLLPLSIIGGISKSMFCALLLCPYVLASWLFGIYKCKEGAATSQMIYGIPVTVFQPP